MIKHLSNRECLFIAQLKKRNNREELGLCICEGLRLCREIYYSFPNLIERCIVKSSFDLNIIDFKGIDIFIASDRQFKKISSTVTPQGIIFVVKIPKWELPGLPSAKREDFYLLLDRISDPGNFGTIIRGAIAAGLNKLWFSKGSVDPFSDKVLRSAMGAQFRISLFEYENVDLAVSKLNSIGIDHIYIAIAGKGESCFKSANLFNRSAIIFGNEANGLKDISYGIPVHIPMPGGFESLNLAQAVTIIMFEYVRRKTEHL